MKDVYILSEIANCELSLGRVEKALDMFRMTHGAFKSTHGDGVGTVREAANLGRCLNACGHFDEATVFMRQEIATAKRALGPGHVLITAMADAFADSVLKRDQASRDELLEAETLLVDASKVADRIYGANQGYALHFKDSLRDVRAKLHD